MRTFKKGELKKLKKLTRMKKLMVTSDLSRAHIILDNKRKEIERLKEPLHPSTQHHTNEVTSLHQLWRHQKVLTENNILSALYVNYLMVKELAETATAQEEIVIKFESQYKRAQSQRRDKKAESSAYSHFLSNNVRNKNI